MKIRTITEHLICDGCDSELDSWNYKIRINNREYDFCINCQDRIGIVLLFLTTKVGMEIKYEVSPYEVIADK